MRGAGTAARGSDKLKGVWRTEEGVMIVEAG